LQFRPWRRNHVGPESRLLLRSSVGLLGERQGPLVDRSSLASRRDLASVLASSVLSGRADAEVTRRVGSRYRSHERPAMSWTGMSTFALLLRASDDPKQQSARRCSNGEQVPSDGMTATSVSRAKGGRARLSGLEVSLREKPPPERGERGDSVVTVVGRVVAAAEFVEQVCPVGGHQ